MLSGSLVTTAWRVLRLRIAENILNKQLRTAVRGVALQFGGWAGANNPHSKKKNARKSQKEWKTKA
jgi:hypothetical protein